MSNSGRERNKKLVVLLCNDSTINVGGALGCILSKLPKVGGAKEPLAPLFQSPLSKVHKYLMNLKLPL